MSEDAAKDEQAKRASRVAKDTTEELAHELAALRADVNAILKTLGSASKDAAGIAKDKAREKLGDVKDKAVSLEDDLIDRVQTNPVQTLGMAFGAGFILSLLMRR